ncbi:MAG: DNA repair protein RecO [Gammaproteobacteria bacterium]|nr:MAG: DNA repair protein RecO [Gammaproteobacteria bacterium]
MDYTPAFILHQRPYRESSVLLDVFSQQYGRVSLIARGTKTSKRNKSGLLQLYQPLLLSWMGRGDLYTLTAVETDEPRYILRAESALCGLYVNELMVKLLPLHLAESDVFDAYKIILLSLQEADNNEISLRLFEKRLLTHLGYGLVLDHDVETQQQIESTQRYSYQADVGLYPWQQSHNRPSISGRSLQHLIDERDFDEQSLPEIKQLMRSVIHFYLGGKPLQSRLLFSSMQRYAN